MSRSETQLFDPACHALTQWPYWPSDQCRNPVVVCADHFRPLCGVHLRMSIRRDRIGDAGAHDATGDEVGP